MTSSLLSRNTVYQANHCSDLLSNRVCKILLLSVCRLGKNLCLSNTTFYNVRILSSNKILDFVGPKAFISKYGEKMHFQPLVSMFS